MIDLTDCSLVNILRQRSSGILLPIFSLPSPHGIGDLGPEAFRFIDFLVESHQSCWQLLPLGPTNAIFGNSPYMSSSAFAGSPLLLSPEQLVAMDLLDHRDICSRQYSEYVVDYQAVTEEKQRLLALAWQRFQQRPDHRDILEDFSHHHPWVIDYGLFCALKQRYDQAPWYEWPIDIRQHKKEALKRVLAQERSTVDAEIFCQWLFFAQWQQLRDYAHQHHIRLIGDLPIYVALDSADAWANQEIFQLDLVTSQPTAVAGVPPDYFSATGQLWGNPLYRWCDPTPCINEALWAWWEQRLRLQFTWTDTIRIDHFRGFAAYWAVAASEETALNGQWQPGPGREFFTEMERRLGTMSIIAEDLGEITPDVTELRQALGYPGMKILLFAFDGDSDNSYLPYNIEKQSVVYTGTHDNDTAVGWMLSPQVHPAHKLRAKRFANRWDQDAGTFHRDLIHLALGAPATLAVLPLQDVLGFGNDCRMNTPGTCTNNWQWRCAERFLTSETAAWLADWTDLFGRRPTLSAAAEAAPPDRNQETAPKPTSDR